MDLNGDGKPDLIGIDGSVYIGNGDGTFTKKAPLPLTGPMAVGDFNGDGKPDVAVTADLSVYVFLGNGDGTFQASIRTITGMSVYALAAGDFNGDGKADLVALSNSTPLFTLSSKGDGTFAPPVTVTGATGTLSIVATGDFNHDGKVDFAAATVGGNAAGTIEAFLETVMGHFRQSRRRRVFLLRMVSRWRTLTEMKTRT